MTPEEVIDILTFAASYDRRTVGKADVAAWHLAIGDLPAADAQTAVVAHYRESRAWLMPADIREHVRAIRAERLRLNPVPAPPAELCDDGPAFAAWVDRQTRRIENGETGPEAIGS